MVPLSVGSAVLAAAVLVAQQAGASTYKIAVGQDGKKAFSPSQLNASLGDTLEFHFYAKNHSVVMGDFDNPCGASRQGGFWSGFGFATNGSDENDNKFTVAVQYTGPIFYYSSQESGSECKDGMSGVINASGSQNLTAYQEASKSAGSAESPDTEPFGGIIENVNATVTPTSTSARSTSTATGSPSGSATGTSTSASASASANAPGSGAGSVSLGLPGMVVAVAAVAVAALLSMP